MGKLLDTTVSDFGGGWNVADSPLNLASRFQPVSDNVIRGVNGSFGARWGTMLTVDGGQGTETTETPGNLTVNVTTNQPFLKITKTAHGLSDGDHVTIPTAPTLTSGSTGTIPLSAMTGTFGIMVIDANTFKIATRYNAASTTSAVLNFPTMIFDDHAIGGNIIHMQYFKQAMLLFSDIGEVYKMDIATETITRLFDIKKADTLSADLAPTRGCTFVTTTTFKSTVISVNGYDNDKPLQIFSNFSVEFLVDKATLTNTNVPRADIVLGMQGYVIMFRTEFGDPFVEFSARNTDATFTREVSPDDAVEVDLSMTTDTVEPIILGAGPFREKLYVAFYDRGMIGTIGVYDGATPPNHTPEFNDTIAEHGTISHRTVVPLGNDIFMADYAGVPSISISLQSGGFVPVRLSELIAPEIQKHLANLSENTLRDKAFAFYNKSDRMYMLFVPKCDEIAQPLEKDPFVFGRDLSLKQRAIVFAPRHKLFEGSYVQIAGAIDAGALVATNINGKRQVVHVIDDNTFVVQLEGTMPASGTTEGGGSNVTITPINDETICYGFEYNRELKIRRWTRIRGLDVDCAGVTNRGRVYFAKHKRVYRYGSNEEPLYADNIGCWLMKWATSVAYSVGNRVLDTDTGVTYECLIDHTSRNTGTFADDRDQFPNNWQEFKGDPINWVLETPWSDISKRGNLKIIKAIGHDSEGEDEFTFSIFTNQIYRSKDTYELVPNRSMQFTAGNYGGYGMKTAAVWGSGRRTREEKRWPFQCRGKLFKMRYEGSTTRAVRISGTTLYYLLGGQ